MRRRQPAATQIDGSAPKLSSLAPEYSFAAHGVYFTILKAAIDSQPDVRNIALSGTYGTGKSSILGQVAKEFDGRVVELSLLTLGAQSVSTKPSEESDSAATSTTNRIQKEIVKQLLYQQRPAKAPESRFRRIVRFRWGAELLIAGIAGAIAIVLALIAGLDIVVSPSVALAFSGRPHVFAVVALFFTIALIVGATTFMVRALIRGRVGIEKVTAGPATITLPPRSASYFDEYLDEIIYFFETNPRRDIVIIEDLDRFNDPNIFEALRSLNGILNAAQQLDGRNVRFIYAVRDSVFEKLGRDETAAATTDEARAELVRANRTKFFELVVPVVPFITHKNARDLMASLLEDRGHKVSKDLIDLAARHLADMRLIHNILNEYEVFKHRLLDVKSPVPELDPDRLFAMILFKNAHMVDFERIRHGASSLDELWEIWRELVHANIDRLRLNNRALRNRISQRTAATRHAKDIAKQLTNRISALAKAPGTGFASSTLQYEGAEISDAKMQSPAFWRKFTEKELPLTILANPPSYNYGPRTMELSRQNIEVLIGQSVDPSKLEQDDAADAEKDIDRNEQDIALLQRHSWAQLAADHRFTYAKDAEQDPIGFTEWVERTLPSRLAADLVIHGYITSYFPLHVSSFYGKLIRPNAITYIMRFVDHGRADADYSLDAEDVEAILRDQGSSVLVERSMFNVDILDHLLVARPDDASIVVRNIPINDSTGTEFVDRYLESGLQKLRLVARLTPRMPGVFKYLATTPTLEPSERVTLIDAGIANRSSRIRYGVSGELRSLVEATYRDLPALAPNAPDEAALKVVQFIRDIEAVVASLVGLTDSVISAFRTTRSYALTRENLELVANTTNLSLDNLAKAGDTVFAYVTDSAAEFTKIFLESETTKHTVVVSKHLIEFLQAVDESESEAVDTVVAHAGSECLVEELGQVPPGTWPTIVRNKRTPITYRNVAAYIDEYGEVDEDLGLSLACTMEISEAEGEDETGRAQMAYAILNSPASSLDVLHRVKLAHALDPGVLLAENIDPRSGRLVGDLIAAGLIADDPDAFSSRLMVDWETQAHAVAKSANFIEFVTSATLDAKFIAPLLHDDELAAAHIHVARAISSYPSVPLAAYQAYAERALAGGYTLSAKGITSARSAGVSVGTTIQLLAKFIGRISSDELREILRLLGKPWSKVADPGFGVTEITDSTPARTILNALRTAGVVSKFPARDGQLRVSLRQK